jgi:lipoprotein NlpD
MRFRTLACAAAMASLFFGGCATRSVHAPVIDRASSPSSAPAPAATRTPDPRPDTYVVKRGDTLFSIALDQGLDYKELASWNSLDNPNVIRVGQELRIKPPPGIQEAPVTIRPITGAGPVESRALGSAEAVKSEPVVRKLPFSPENLALLQRGEPQPAPPPKSAPVPVSRPESSAKPESDGDVEDAVDWGWPVRGRILAGFSEATNKGVDIAGKAGDAVLASAPGRVVYSGQGLRGYGKLIIIKHNKTYLSAYAHNREILVKEGQNVVKGQKIAEVGSTDTDAPKLHFEIRRLGKPVDPSKFLPPA